MRRGNKLLKKIAVYRKVLLSEKGQGLTEYGLIIALIAVAAIVAMRFLGESIAQKFNDVKDEIQNAKPANF